MRAKIILGKQKTGHNALDDGVDAGKNVHRPCGTNAIVTQQMKQRPKKTFESNMQDRSGELNIRKSQTRLSHMRPIHE